MSKETSSIEIGGRTLSFETGHIAKQAAGSVIVTMGETVILVAVTHADMRPGFDFFPLMVDYRERGYASGKIFGGRFNKREGRPSTRETLISRMTDRPIRPLWPENYKRDVLIQALSLSAEDDVDPDTMVINGASAALCLSDLPFQGPIGAVRVGHVDGDFILNPTPDDLEKSDIDLLVAGTATAITMVEAGADAVKEEVMVEALMFGHEAIKSICAAQVELREKAGKPEMEYIVAEKPAIVKTIIDAHSDECLVAVRTPEKDTRAQALSTLKKSIFEKYVKTEEDGDDSDKPSAQEVGVAFSELKAKAIRTAIKEDNRVDGRNRTTVRPIESIVGFLPRTHGSALFTRGETQAIVTVTLGTSRDEQLHETLRGEWSEKFLLHYNFPSFSVGEVRPPRGPGRREIGHGMLAKRSLEPMMPDSVDFPYTVRVCSEITESNGSSSMATVCGGCLSMMDAGVPLKAPVAGIAMGLVADEDGEFIITDILGDEDHYGDMDFKVAGTKDGITALQMDIKMSGLSAETLTKALAQANEGRLHILGEMEKAITTPRDNISKWAPKIISIEIPKTLIGKIIGPGGANIRGMEEEFNVKVDIDEEDDIGIVTVSSTLRDDAENCAEKVRLMTAKPEVGKTYKGKIVSVKDFGVFVEIIPGTEGLCHVSQLDYEFIKDIRDFCKEGDAIEVKLLEIDELGRLRLSRKALLERPEGYVERESDNKPRRSGGGGKGGGCRNDRR